MVSSAPRRRRLAGALVSLLVFAAPLEGRQAAAPGPLTEAELVFLLDSGVTSARLRSLVERFGVAFAAAPETLAVLRAAGADADLVAAVRRAALARAPAIPPGRGTPAPAPSSAESRVWPEPVSPSEPRMVPVADGPRGDFYLSAFEISNRQYLAFCARSGRPRPEAPYWGLPDDMPVVNVSWHDAITFCNWLSLETGRKYRLPTEAEWEYAARGGLVRRAYPWGDQPPVGRACFGKGELCRVGSFKPNGFGLYDMAGSVAEWCQDLYETGGKARTIRGGGWSDPEGKPELLLVARREKLDADRRRNDVGFRVAGER